METDSFQDKEFVLRVVKIVRPIDVIVVISSMVAMYLFRLQDGFELTPIWQLKRNSTPQMNQIQPLIADLDGNGLKEMLIASENKIEMFSFHSDEFDDEHEDEQEKEGRTTGSVLFHLHQKAEVAFSKVHSRSDETTTVYPVAMNSGCITASNSEICSQVLAVVWSDWTVTLSQQLKILWRSKPMKIAFEPKLKITEMSVVVATGNESVFGENGLIIVGGVLNLKDHETSDSARHNHSKQVEVGKTADEISSERAGVEPNKENGHAFSHHLGPILSKYVGHFTSYALDGGTGEIRWKHEPGDFETEVKQEEEEEPRHFKLRLKKKSLHRGEVHWKKYSQSFLKHLPYSWTHATDTRISLAEFKRAVSKPHEKAEGSMAEQLMALAKTGITSSPQKDIQDLNAVVIRHRHGIEVLSINKGSPLCSLPFDAKHSTLADVNGDESIDLVKLHVYRENSKSDCFLVASDALSTSSVLFNSSVCQPTPFVGLIGEATSSVNENIRNLPPLLTRTVKRSFVILHHVIGRGLYRKHVGMDTIVLTSSGKLSAFEPSGRFLWQIDTGFTWSQTDSFVPSMKMISLSLEGIQDGVIVLGSRELIVVSLLDGSILSTHSLPCVPVHPLVLGDINNDINDEFLVRCSDRYIAFSLERYNRIWLSLLMYSGIACFVGFLLFVIKFLEREEFPFDTFDHIFKAMRLFPLQGTKL